MKTSLIVSTYNRPDALRLTLKSIARQRLLPSEVIIADDGSTNETKLLVDEFAANFPIPIQHVWQEDKGFRLAAIRNKAIKKASGEFLIFTDGDIILHKDFIQSHISFALPKHFCQGHRVLLNASATKKAIENEQLNFGLFDSGINNRLYAFHHLGFSKLMSKTVLSEEKVKGCNFSCYREDAIKINGFNESFIGWGKEDAEFIARLINSGVKGIDIKFAAVAFHLDHGENFKKKTEDALPNNLLFVEKAKKEKLTWCDNGILKKTY
ncbi:MAG: glycosyltransferase family 2 protein [Chitinophagales bacterium]